MSEIVEKLERMADGLEQWKERLEAVELNQNRIPAPGAGGESKDLKQAKEDFRIYINTGDTSRLSGKSLEAGSTPGSYAVQSVLARRVDDQLMDNEPLYGEVGRFPGTPESGDISVPVAEDDMEAGRAGETDTRNVTGNPTLHKVTLTKGEYYAVPKMSNWFVEDATQDPVAWVMGRYARKVGLMLGEDIISGNGTNRLTGILNTTPENTGDHDSPARTWGAIEYVKTGDASGFGSLDTGSPSHYPADVLYDTLAALRPVYRPNAKWCMNSNTLNTVSKFKDADGRYLVSYGLREGEPTRLLGYPVILSENMADVSNGAYPVLFGNFREAYMMTPIGSMVSIPDRVTVKGYLLLYLARRYAGNLVDPDALVAVKVEA
jgi:HK97 family phage major capsid protein